MLTPTKNIVKILLFEFSVGGGFSKQALPASLINEGELMLRTITSELSSLLFVQLTIFLDWRCQHIKLPHNINVIYISEQHNFYDKLSQAINSYHFIWPIAPEIDAILLKTSTLIYKKAKLLNSLPQAISICSDKLLTAQRLQQSQIKTIETTPLLKFSQPLLRTSVIKPKDGAGCLHSYVVTSQSEFNDINSSLDNRDNYIIQPFIKGDSLSLSCLFKNGNAWLLCCNRQHILINQQKVRLTRCDVNIPSKHWDIYQQLINQVAQSILGLWGYVGIDIIQPENGEAIIVEINPRLTSSYVGINQATGINVGKEVLSMVHGSPTLQRSKNRPYTVNI